jgi:hypothetical protein
VGTERIRNTDVIPTTSRLEMMCQNPTVEDLDTINWGKKMRKVGVPNSGDWESNGEGTSQVYFHVQPGLIQHPTNFYGFFLVQCSIQYSKSSKFNQKSQCLRETA